MKCLQYEMRPNIEFGLVNELQSKERGITVRDMVQPLMRTLKCFPMTHFAMTKF